MPNLLTVTEQFNEVQKVLDIIKESKSFTTLHIEIVQDPDEPIFQLEFYIDGVLKHTTEALSKEELKFVYNEVISTLQLILMSEPTSPQKRN